MASRPTSSSRVANFHAAGRGHEAALARHPGRRRLRARMSTASSRTSSSSVPPSGVESGQGPDGIDARRVRPGQRRRGRARRRRASSTRSTPASRRSTAAADDFVRRGDDRARRRRPDHDRAARRTTSIPTREAHRGRSRGDPPRRWRVRRDRRCRRGPAGLGRHDCGQGRRDPAGQRHRRHPARSSSRPVGLRALAPPSTRTPSHRRRRGARARRQPMADPVGHRCRRPPARRAGGRAARAAGPARPRSVVPAPPVALVLGVGDGLRRGRTRRHARRSSVIASSGLDLVRTWSDAAEAIVMDLRLPRVLTAMRGRNGPRRRRCHVPGPPPQSAGRPVRARARRPVPRSGRRSRSSSRSARGPRVRAAPWPRVRRRARSRSRRLPVRAPSGLAPITSLLLTGYAVGSLLAAGLAMAMYLSGAGAPPDLLLPAGRLRRGVVGAPRRERCRSSSSAAAAIMPRARSLNGLLLGEETAAHLGVDVRRERAILLGLASLVTAAAVAVSGLIGFVGLVVPHVVRLLVGPIRPARAAALGARRRRRCSPSPTSRARLLGEIPVGVVTALIGAPFFIVRPAALARGIRAVSTVLRLTRCRCRRTAQVPSAARRRPDDRVRASGSRSSARMAPASPRCCASPRAARADRAGRSSWRDAP